MNKIFFYAKNAFKEYATFEGRAHRAEYWYFLLFNIIVSSILGIADGIIGGPFNPKFNLLGDLYSLISLVPGVAVAVRRMHDVNKNGWWILFPIYNLFLLAKKGDEGANNYGEKSKVI